MKGKTRKNITERLSMIERKLSNAEEYLARMVNVEGSSWLHMDDWRGRSGHPSWMRNFMIPTMLKYRAKKERALQSIDTKAKDKALTQRKRQEGFDQHASVTME
jgi:hypothetical protein